MLANDCLTAFCAFEFLLIGLTLLRMIAPAAFFEKVVDAMVPLISEIIAPGVNFAML